MIRGTDDTTHPVGSTPRGLRVRDRVFYDLIGNVLKWTHDGWSNTLVGGSNPVVSPAKGFVRSVRGGNWFEPEVGLRSSSVFHVDGARRFGTLGFRLARTLKQN